MVTVSAGKFLSLSLVQYKGEVALFSTATVVPVSVVQYNECPSLPMALPVRYISCEKIICSNAGLCLSALHF